MGGTKKLSKIIVHWENGTRSRAGLLTIMHGAHRAGKCFNFAQLYLRNEINEPKNSIAKGPLYL